MSDRTSAGIFSGLFEFLAENPDQRSRAFAERIWKDAANYDFDWRQMECDDALIKLGLAKRGIDPDYPNDGQTTLYRSCRGWTS